MVFAYIGSILTKTQTTINSRASIKYSKNIPTKTPTSPLLISSRSLDMENENSEIEISDFSASENQYQCFKNAATSELIEFLTGTQCLGRIIKLTQNIIPDEMSNSYIKGFFMNYIYKDKVVKFEKLNFNESTSIKYGYDGDNRIIFDHITFAINPNAINTPINKDFKKEFSALQNSWKFDALKLSAKDVGIDFETRGKIFIFDEDTNKSNSKIWCYMDTKNPIIKNWKKSFNTFSQRGCNGVNMTIYQDMIPNSTGKEDVKTQLSLFLNYKKNGKTISQVLIPYMSEKKMKIGYTNPKDSVISYESIEFNVLSTGPTQSQTN